MLTRIAICVALTCLCAQIVIPLPILPITLQTVGCLIAGFLLGAKYGALSQLLYIALGLFGLPVFSAAGGGLGYVLRPSFGFILGFVLAAYIVGTAYPRLRGAPRLRALLAGGAGMLALYGVGIAYMYISMNSWVGKPIAFGAVLASMALPLVKDIACLGILALVVPRLRAALRLG